MKCFIFGKYTYMESESVLMPPEYMCKLPVFESIDQDTTGLCILSIGKEYESTLSFSLDRETYNTTVNMFSDSAVLIIFLLTRLRKKPYPVRVFKKQVSDDLLDLLKTYFDFSRNHEFIILLNLKVNISQSLEKELDKILDISTMYTMTLVVDRKKLEVPATTDYVVAFNRELISQTKSGYIILPKDLPNYGELINFIARFRHSCLEFNLTSGCVRAWVLLCPILIPGQEFPTANELVY